MRLRWFLIGGITVNAFLHLAVYVFCTLGWGLHGDTDPGAVGFFDSPVTRLLAYAAIGLVAATVLLSFVMRSRRIAVMVVGWLIDRHTAAKRAGHGYHALWLEKRAARIWKRINPTDGKQKAASIGRVIQAGYGLHPEAMPKRETKRPVYDGPRVVVSDGVRRVA